MPLSSSLETPSEPPQNEHAARATVQVHALSAGHFTLPEEQFVSPCTQGARKAVPSLCFLIQHRCPRTNATTRIVFDLGLRRSPNRYAEPIRRHLETRQPMTTDPDIVKSLKRGGLTADDIDYVVYSHVHWDHVGEPRDFMHSKFVVGHGSLGLLSGKSASLRGGHSFFETDLLDLSRTIELSSPGEAQTDGGARSRPLASSKSTANFSGPWGPMDGLPETLDVFQDGSLYIVNAPGHLPGHINMLARTAVSHSWVYLAGDACHDRRIIRKEREIGEWLDAHGHACCIHANRAQAQETIERIRTLESQGVEVILAHDVEWESDSSNRTRFFGVLE